MGLVSFTAIREGLAANLENIEGLRVFPYVPDSVSPPAAFVAPVPVQFLTFDTTFTRGSDDMTFIVTLIVSRAWDRTGQNNLDKYLAGSGENSVKTAIESDPTLGGAAMSTACESARNYGAEFAFGQVPFYGCEFVVSVYA